MRHGPVPAVDDPRDVDLDFSTALFRAFGGPVARARTRDRNEDFRVDEVLRFEPDGEGDHAWLRIEKQALNTRDVARRLARHAGVKPVDVGFAGQKDRRAVARQWFSVNLSGLTEPDWRSLENECLRILAITRHGKKLRRGQLAGNRFLITLRDVEGDRAVLEALLGRVSVEGVPNYFGPQRFGRGDANIKACVNMVVNAERVRDRYRRGMYLSAGRAWIFNQVLSARVAGGTWNAGLPGDILMFDDSRGRFLADPDESTGDPRIPTLELHPTGPLWGRGSPETKADAGALERDVAGRYFPLCKGLEAAGLESDRRALRLKVQDLDYRMDETGVVELSFFLRAGAFATTVLAELFDLEQNRDSRPNASR
ncbi:MAG: tRNA pseudouridine(13) synthase TruD [Gammaproteobacteria bacterium]|nr:tRNA pseudouridine(13) synthase TruD [Gammaproteobacteria bacterium]